MDAVPLYMDEVPINVSPRLAAVFGINKAVIVQKLHFLIAGAQANNDLYKFVDGHWWTYGSYQEWREKFFIWLSEAAVKTILRELEKSGIVVTRQGVKNRRDRRKWYRIDTERFNQAVRDFEAHQIKIIPSKTDSPSDKNYPIHETDSISSNTHVPSDNFYPIHEIKNVPSIGQNLSHPSDNFYPIHEIKNVPCISVTTVTTTVTDSVEKDSPDGETPFFASTRLAFFKAYANMPLQADVEQPKPKTTRRKKAATPSAVAQAEKHIETAMVVKANDPDIQMAVADAFKIKPGGYAGVLAQQLLGQDKRGATHKISPPMDAIEIVQLGMWYRDQERNEFDDEPAVPHTAQRLWERVLQFRDDEPKYTNCRPLAKRRLENIVRPAYTRRSTPIPQPEAVPVEFEPPTPEQVARIESVIDRLAKSITREINVHESSTV